MKRCTRVYPKISVIIPFHNAEESISPTLEALQASSLPLLEVICVDDASTDDTEERIREFAARSSLTVKFLRSNPEKRGAAAARNQGAQEAIGDYLLFVDADVVVEQHTLERMFHSLSDQPCIAVVAQFRDCSHQPGILAHFQAYVVSFVYASLDPYDSPCLGTQCLMMKASTFYATGGFNETYSGATVEDFAFGYRLRAQGYKICIASNANIVHNHKYSFLGFVRNYYTKARDLTLLLLNRPDVSLSDTGYYHISNLSVLIVTFLEILILFTAMIYEVHILWVGCAVTLIVPILWRDFIRHVANEQGWLNAFYFFGLRVFVILIGWTGSASALVEALVRNSRDFKNRGSSLYARLLELLRLHKIA